MLPKFRAWYILAEQMITEITSISYIHHAIIGKDGDGDMLVPIKFYDERNGPEVLLMQSTGLFDKNGVEIFEGDVVKHTESEMTAIIRMHPILGMGMEAEGEVAWADIDLEELTELKKECEKYYEVIGNIYENPELVE